MWKDISSFSRDDKERIPNIFELSLFQPLKITIIWNHLYHPNQWVYTAFPIWKYEIELGLTEYSDFELAKSRALQEVIQHLEDVLKSAKSEL